MHKEKTFGQNLHEDTRERFQKSRQLSILNKSGTFKAQNPLKFDSMSSYTRFHNQSKLNNQKSKACRPIDSIVGTE